MDTEEPVKIQPSRRRFVEVLLGGGLFASILSAIYPQRMQAGQAALAERDYRRKGRGFALAFILITVLGLFLYLRQIESPAGNA